MPRPEKNKGRAVVFLEIRCICALESAGNCQCQNLQRLLRPAATLCFSLQCCEKPVEAAAPAAGSHPLLQLMGSHRHWSVPLTGVLPILPDEILAVNLRALYASKVNHSQKVTSCVTQLR